MTHRLRIASYNIHAGVGAGRYRHYITRSWRHVVPHPARWRTLDAIARQVAPFDLVGLQETDAGSFRTGHLSPTEHLARVAGFPYWWDHETRRVGALSRHGNGLLSRLRPHRVQEHSLPGGRGRGALLALFGPPEAPLAVLVAHLALSRRARSVQVDYLAGVLQGRTTAVVMGDFNCEPHSPELSALTRAAGLRSAGPVSGTYPSWAPWRRLDHVLVTPDIEVVCSEIPRWSHSDHLPVTVVADVPLRAVAPRAKRGATPAAG